MKRVQAGRTASWLANRSSPQIWSNRLWSVPHILIPTTINLSLWTGIPSPGWLDWGCSDSSIQHLPEDVFRLGVALLPLGSAVGPAGWRHVAGHQKPSPRLHLVSHLVRASTASETLSRKQIRTSKSHHCQSRLTASASTSAGQQQSEQFIRRGFILPCLSKLRGTLSPLALLSEPLPRCELVGSNSFAHRFIAVASISIHETEVPQVCRLKMKRPLQRPLRNPWLTASRRFSGGHSIHRKFRGSKC